MKKVLLTTAIVLCTICAMALTCSAADPVILDNMSSIVAVSGTATPGTYVSVTMLNPDCDEDDFDNNPQEAVQYFKGMIAKDANGCGHDGNYCFHFQITGKSGDFTIITNTDGVKTSQPYTFYPAANKQAVIRTINETSELTAAIVADAMTNFSLKGFALYVDTDAGKAAIADALEALKTQAGGSFEYATADDLNAMANTLKEACLIAAYNTDNSAVLASGGSLLYLKEMIGLADTDDEMIDYNGKIGTDDLIDDKSLVMNDMFKNTYTTVAQIKDAFKKSVRFRVLVNYNAYGYGHISNYFAKYDTYYKEVGFKLDEFSNISSKDDIYAAVAASSAADINALKDEFNGLVDNPPSSGDDDDGGYSGGISFGGGGGGSVPNNTADEEEEEPEAPVTEPEPTPPAVETVGGFADVPVTHWAAEPIKALAEEGILTGRGNGSFDIDGTITRAELIKIAVISTIGAVDDSAANPFGDANGHWAKSHIATAVKAGITTGITDTEFNPDGLITREQAATILYRAIVAKGIKLENKGEAFADDATISDWAKDGVYALKAAGVISGRDGNNFCAGENLTRAEAAKLVYVIKNLK